MAKKLAFDKALFTAAILLTGLGLTMVYSASGIVSTTDSFAMNPFFKKQAMAAVVGLVGMVLAMHFDYRRLNSAAAANAIAGGVLLLLVLVLFAPPINGTRRWLLIGNFSLQPSELAKLAVVVFLAYRISLAKKTDNEREWLWPSLLIAGLMAGLIMIETDLGTALLLAGASGLMLFLAGMRWRLLAAGAAILLPTMTTLVFLVERWRQRILTYLDPDAEPLLSSYQVSQSLIAVGSGGVFGLGPGQSLQKLYFLPYAHSDFIYAILGEELGFLGAVAVLMLFAMIAWRGARAGWTAPDPFGRYLAWGLTGVIVLQALLNMSVVLAVLPTTGIPLPFISFGGTSLVVSLVACGVLLNVSQHG